MTSHEKTKFLFIRFCWIHNINNLPIINNSNSV